MQPPQSHDTPHTAVSARSKIKIEPAGIFVLPAWALSVLFHAGVLVVLGVTIQFAPSGTADEPGREVSVVLKHVADQHEYYERPNDDEATTDAVAQPSVDLFDEVAPLDPTEVLPQVEDWLVPGGASADVPSASQAATGPSGPGKLPDGRARTGVFGIMSEGYKFVYVFDRSGSMGGLGRSPLNAAKSELMASLEHLEETHQFQIIFYNQQPVVFDLAGQSGRLVFGNERNKTLAQKFIRSITADGATRHEEALKMALGMRPDVIFFLTDADEPSLSPTQLASIAKANGGRTQIHAIEFGFGPFLGQENFLMRLAAQNDGEHRYVDTSTFRVGPAPEEP